METATICPACGGDGSVPAVTEREIFHPDYRDWDGSPLAECVRCKGEGEVVSVH